MILRAKAKPKAIWKQARALALPALFALCAGPAQAAIPIAGEWTVADKTARIDIVDCDGAAWGYVSWEQMPGGLDSKNPDPAKRSRATLGMPILLGMMADGKGAWTGRIYNSDNGKFYTGSLRLRAPNVLAVRGCVLGILCGGEDWARFEPSDNAPPMPKPAFPCP
jgi:uncharacterized protein (DUF2147 family)